MIIAPWLPASALLGAALGTGVLLLVLRRADRPALAWIPVHIAILATGGLHSALLPVTLAWMAWVATRVERRIAIGFGGVALGLLVGADVMFDRLDLAGINRAVGLLLAGAATVLVVAALSARAGVHERGVARLMQDLRNSESVNAEAQEAERELVRTLNLVSRSAGARRAVLWDVDPGGGTATPRAASSGRLPDPLRLYGDPLRWTWSEGVPLRVERGAAWAPGAPLAAGVALQPRAGGLSLLTIEYGADAPIPDDAVLEEVAAYLRAFVTLQQRQEAMLHVRERYAHIMELLNRLPRSLDPAQFGEQLVESARALTGASGGALSLAVNGGGTIMAAVGDDGGPEVGARFGPSDSELGLAGAAGTPLVRPDRKSQSPRPAVAAPGERWRVEPRSVLAIPLRSFDHKLVGTLVVWSPEKGRFGDEIVAVLSAVAPYAAQQLMHASAYSALKDDAARDALTGIYNRGAFDAHFANECARYHRHPRPFSIALLDIDHFKRINDNFGHEAGDDVLREVGHALSGSLRTSDFAARYGGEEFVIVLPETDLRAAGELGERLRARIAALDVRSGGRSIPVRASVGVASCPASVERPEDLLQTADAMLYRAKQGGRDRVEVAAHLS